MTVPELYASSVSTMAVLILSALVIFAFAWLVLRRSNVDPREPPVVKPAIPFIGHILGMARQGSLYFKQLRSVGVLSFLPNSVCPQWRRMACVWVIPVRFRCLYTLESRHH